MCTIPNPSHEKLRKQNALFLFFYGVPLPPPKGTKDQGRKLAPGTGKDIITYSRAEPSGLHPCHRSRNSVVSKGKEHYQGKGEGGSIQFIENAGNMACVRSYWVMGVP